MFPHPRKDSEEPESTPVEEEPSVYNSEDDEQYFGAENTPVEEEPSVYNFEDDEQYFGAENTPVEEEPSVYNSEDDEQYFGASQRSDTQVQSSGGDSYGKRSPIELFVDLGEKIEVVLGNIGAKVSFAINAKRQKMETDLKESFEGTDQKMKQTWNAFEDSIAKLTEDSAQSFINLFEEWNLDFQNLQEKQKKLVNDFQQEVNCFQQCRLVQNQRLRTVKQVHEQFLKNLEDMEKETDNQLLGIQNELKEELNKLKKNYERISTARDG